MGKLLRGSLSAGDAVIGTRPGRSVLKSSAVLLGTVATTITIVLTASLVYPTRAEVENRINGLNSVMEEKFKSIDMRLGLIHDSLKRSEKMMDNIMLQLKPRGKYGRGKRDKRSY